MSTSASPPPQGGASPGSAGAGNEVPKGLFARRFPSMYARYARISASPLGRFSNTVWTRKRPIFLGFAITYGVVSYGVVRYEAFKRDTIHPDSWIVLKVYPGSIVECKTTPTLSTLLRSSSPGDDLPRVMELYDVCRAIKFAAIDDRIRGIFADFSGLHVPSEVVPEPLGLAQIEEVVESIHEFKIMKKEQRRIQDAVKMLTEKLPKGGETILAEQTEEFMGRIRQGEALEDILKEDDKPAGETEALGQGGETVVSKKEQVKASMMETFRQIKEHDDNRQDDPVTIAWADSFDSQGTYLLASAFDEVYIQPSGHIPLTGTRMQIPFFKRALDWLGIKVHAEARRDYKSMVSSYVQNDGLPPAQVEDEARLLGELSRNIAHMIGVNRYAHLQPEEAANKVAEMSSKGPFSAREAEDLGLITGIKYKSEVIKLLGEEPKLRSLKSYLRILNTNIDRYSKKDEKQEIAVVYLLGGISEAPGEFSASQVIKGLREAGEDEDVGAVVLRIDSGGGSALTSDSIWDAVRRVQEEHNKPVVASFGNMSASGGYYASACADYIMACESTVTGSIGVAALRPTLTKSFFDMIKVRVQTIFSGSNSLSMLHEMTEDEKERFARQTDETYELFLEKVCSGRKIDRKVVEELADGRVYTGLAAWVKCNPEQALDADENKLKEIIEDEQSGEDGERANRGKDDTRNAPVDSSPTDWEAVDVTEVGQMSTLRIRAKPVLGNRKASRSSSVGDGQDDGAVKAFVREMAAQLQSDDETSLNNSSIEIVPSSTSKLRTSKTRNDGDNVNNKQTIDEESRLAMRAHEEAKATLTNDNGEDEKKKSDEEAKLGPYGRGLIDAIGGIWDATYKAKSMAIDRELEKMIKDGMTVEEAREKVLPGASRAIFPDGSLEIGSDVRLVRYPKERTFRERVREMNQKGDEPSLSLFMPSFVAGLGAEVREYVSDLAVQLFVRSWSDPSFVRKVNEAVEKEQKVKMDYSNHIYY